MLTAEGRSSQGWSAFRRHLPHSSNPRSQACQLYTSNPCLSKLEPEECGGKLMLCLSVCIQAVQHSSRGSRQATGQYMMVLPGVAAAREG